MAERILIPLDGSSLGEAALEYVNSFIAKLSPETQVSVILFHVVIEPKTAVDSYYGNLNYFDLPNSKEKMDELKKESQMYLVRLAKKISGDNIEVENQLVEGDDPAEEIIKAEQKFECDLVAMSTHGRSGFSRWAFGSVTDKVLRGGSVPVLMVRAQES
ncbi:MAG: universal stress protein [Spirochaetia bacterium]|nr:universal stress protein [Spirochaetia bacterium]